MKKYLNHLEQMYDGKTFHRKIDYIKYNFSEILHNLNSKNISVLEVGPGMGEYVSYLNNLGIDTIDIVDNDKNVLNYVKKRYKIKKCFLNDNISLIDDRLGKYDLIVLIQLLEHLHVTQYKKTIQTLYKHLKKGGNIVVVVPNANNPLGIVERYADLQHYSSFTEQSLKDLINYSEIDDFKLYIRGWEIPPYSIVNIARIFLQKILHIFLLLLLIINGGIFFRIMTPNIMIVVRKRS